MTDMTPAQEASYALDWNVRRTEPSLAAQLEHDRPRPAGERGRPGRLPESWRQRGLPGSGSTRISSRGPWPGPAVRLNP